MPVPKTKDFAVKFGRQPDMGLEKQKAFPFIYTFISYNDDTWTPHATLTAQSDAIDNIVKGIGPLVKANSKYTQNVILDADYAFKLLTIRYTAYGWCPVSAYPPAGVAWGPYFWDINIGDPPTLASDGGDREMPKLGMPLLHYISMTLSFQGSGSQMLYGGDSAAPLGNVRLPVPIDVMQGNDPGTLSVRTPRLLPAQGTLVFEITNSHPTIDIAVGALIYGMKVRV